MGDDKKRTKKTYRIHTDPNIKWFILAMIVSVFVVLLYPNLVITRHQYQLGDIVERDIKAPKDFFIEDRMATEASRQQIENQVLTVYDHDPRIAQQLTIKVRTAFDAMQKVIAHIKDQQQPSESGTNGQTVSPEERWLEIENELLTKKPVFESKLGIKISEGAFKLLIAEKFSDTIADRISQVLHEIQTNGVVANKEMLIKEASKGIILRNIPNQTEKKITALRQYYGLDQARTMIRIVAEPLVLDMDYNMVNLIVDICQSLVQPNITLNRNETEKRKELALLGVKPIMYKFKAGEMLIREGERIDQEHMFKLQALERQYENRHVISTAIGAALAISVCILVFYVLYFKNVRHLSMNTNRNMLFMGLMLVMVLATAKMSAFFSAFHPTELPFTISSSSVVYAVPASAGAMLVCIFLGFEIALPFSLIVSVCLALLFGNRLELFIFFLISSAMGAYWVQRCRERKLLIIAGIKLGLVNIVLTTTVDIFISDYMGFKLLTDWSLAFLGSMFSAIVTVGLAPLIEMTFRYTTDITLLELANLDRPILRRLMLEAPGTYHHSVIVGSLVEAAAAEIGANSLLAKVCGYYHDIGKVKKPFYFIENQKNGKNKHDKLAPSMSSLILIAHVKDGIEIAKQNKLSPIIIDNIQQHHGTSLISYFYNKAKQIKGAEAVKMDDYRYPGPKPQTIEAGLVMLADVVEAASRTLENPTPARIQGLVQNLINKIFSDGQLDNCELTLKDLHLIAKSFIKILTGIHHHRIEYSDTVSKDSSKGKHGNPDRQPADKTPLKEKNDSEESKGHLKRLGLP